MAAASVMVLISFTPSPGLTANPHLDDSNTASTAKIRPAAPGAYEVEKVGFPRIGLTEQAEFHLAPNQDPKWFAKYDMVGFKGQIHPAAVMQKHNPAVLCLRQFSCRAYQAGNSMSTISMPFLSTGPVTDKKGQVYAGHWLYEAGTKTTEDISAEAMSVHVEDPSRLTVEKGKSGKSPGVYAVLYDPPAGSFRNAEHVFIKGADPKTKVVTFSTPGKGGSKTRALKSTPRSHPAGSILAFHVRGQVSSPATTFWSYNHGTVCPKDANGKRLNEVMPECSCAPIDVCYMPVLKADREVAQTGAVVNARR